MKGIYTREYDPVEFRALQFQKCIEYIKTDIIGKQKNGNYCKYSKVLKSIVVTELTQASYYDYWLRFLGNKLTELQQTTLSDIVKAKFKSDILSADEMIQMETESDDKEEEKKAILKVLKSVKGAKVIAETSRRRENMYTNLMNLDNN